MTRAIIFDVDGTLVDTVDLHAQAWVDAFRHFGFDVSFDAVRAQIGKGGDQLMPVFVPEDVLAAREEEIDSFRSNLFKRDYLPQAKAFPGVRDLFQHIRDSGQKAVLASSGKKEEVEHHMALARIEDLVDGATSADDAERSKPFPDIFEAALEKLAPLRADDAVVVGDTRFDAQAARRAGIRPVGVLCGGFPQEDLTEAGCIAVFRDPEDLLRNYDSSPLSPR